jgi:hypothetical protein
MPGYKSDPRTSSVHGLENDRTGLGYGKVIHELHVCDSLYSMCLEHRAVRANEGKGGF